MDQWLEDGPLAALLHEHDSRRCAAVEKAGGFIDRTGILIPLFSRPTAGGRAQGRAPPPGSNRYCRGQFPGCPLYERSYSLHDALLFTLRTEK
jgi:hypothetical protein